MKTQSLLISGFLICGLLSACPSEEETDKQSSGTPSRAPSTVASKAANSTTKSPKLSEQGIERGIVVLADGIKTFKKCGSKEYIWLYDTNNKVSEKYNALSPAELEPIYAELKGEEKSISIKDGAEADYKTAFTVKEVVTVAPWNKYGDCFQEELSGEGSDWSLHVIKGDEVLFKDLKSEFPLVESLAYSAGKGNTYEFKYNTPNPDLLKVALTEEKCEHNGTSFSHKAEIEFHDETYTGCINKK